MNPPGFVPARQQDCWSWRTEPSRPAVENPLSGAEARGFYEGLTREKSGGGPRGSAPRCDVRGGPGTGRRHEGGQARPAAAREHGGRAGQAHGRSSESRGRGGGGRSVQAGPPTELQGLKLLRCAQDGDLPGLEELLARGVDVNFQDSFFWTAMMCASWAGQRAVVRRLLRRGAAWVGVVDTQGRDARELALTAGHQGVLQEFDGYESRSERVAQADNSEPQPRWCDECGSRFSGSAAAHLSSTLHQFSRRRSPATPHYCLPASSASYKMMLRCGWSPGAGLGPEAGGPRQPVPTVLKRDQKGLGYGPAKKARVTHFQAQDARAVRAPAKERDGRGDGGKMREEGRRKEEEQRNWERDFRASFYL